MIGRTLGNYRIIEQIGLGGMATVFKGYDPDTDRYVAIKILPQHFSGDPQFRQRFQREAKAIAKLEHIHILPIFAYGEDEGISYMAMRYLQAGTLTDRIGEGALPFDEASRVLNQLASALDYAHAHGILHRDMKPSNVLLDDDGNAYLMDFGLAKIVEATVDLTGDRLLGTPAYMSPEQCKGEPVGPTTDIYSLGIILYEMVTGRRPFHAETPIAVILQQLNDPLPPPRNARPDLPEKAENVIFKALAKNPESRYKTAGDLAAAFARAIAEADTAVGVTRPAPLPEPEPPPPMPAPVVEGTAVPEATAVPAPKRRLPAWAWGIIGVVAAATLISLGIVLANLGRGDEEMAAMDEPTKMVEPAVANQPTPPPSPKPDDAPPSSPGSDGAMQPQPQTQCWPDQTQLFFDDFEDGNLEGWDFFDVNGRPSTAGWEIVAEDDGNRVLAGTGHNWAHAQNTFGKDYSLTLRLREAPDSPDASFHINVRMGGDGRYFITDNHIEREPGSESVAQWDYRQDDLWHDIRIDARGSHIEIYWDGRLIANFDDPEPVLTGIIALENTGGVVWYDDILLCEISAPPDKSTVNADNTPLSAWEAIEPVRQQNDFDINGAPSWSPDRKQIAFAALKPGDNRSTDTRIYFVNADGSGLTQLPAVGNSVAPAWSPDGQWLAFHNGCDLARMRTDGSEFTIIWDHTEDNSCIHEPQWSPDGRWLVFASSSMTNQEPPSSRQIRIATAAGEVDVLTAFTVNDANCDAGQVAFSPDGSQIAYVDGDCQPQLMQLDTRESKSIAKFPYWWTATWYPQWADFMDGEEETAVPAGNIHFVDSGQIIGEASGSKLALGDLNGDGTLDVFIPHGVALETWLNDGRGRFVKGNENQADGPNDVSGNQVALGDLDGDGDLDALVGIYQNDDYGGDNIVWFNDGGGSFTDSGQRLGGSLSWAVALGDFDGDGDLDAFDASGNSSKVWLNEGDGRFRDSNQSFVGGDSVHIGLGDLDGDGDLDAFIANFGQGEPNEVFLNDGHGRFQSAGQQLGQSASIGVALGDLDGDGDLDAFVANGKNGREPNAVWLNEGNGRFRHSGQLLGDSDSWAVALGDLDGDGDLDAFVGNGPNIGGQSNTIWLNDGTGQFSDSGLRLGDSATRGVALADLDGDGDLDAFVSSEEANKIWLNQSGG